MKLVKLEWSDAVCDSGWNNISYVKEKDVEHCITVGFLFHETETAYYISNTLVKDDDGILGYNIIPKSMTIEIYEISDKKSENITLE